MSRRAKLAISFLFFFLLGWIYIEVGRVPGSASELERKLATAADRSLEDAGMASWAQVDVDGRRAVLTGFAPDEDSRQLALEAVRLAAPGGGIARVEDRTDLMVLANPYTFEAIFDEGHVTINGYAPDRSARDAILEHIEDAFRSAVDVADVKIATGAPEGADWLSAVELGLGELARLRRGVLWIEDEQISLEGLGASPDVYDDVTRRIRQAPLPFVGRARIAVAYTADSVRSDATPEAPGTSVREACQRDIDVLMDAEEVRFQFDGAEIAPESDALLSAVAAVARRCGQFHFLIGGHAEATSDPAFNADLSEQRARAVADHLTREGVDPEGLELMQVGDGALADDHGAAQSTQNRRIEITVVEPTEPRP